MNAVEKISIKTAKETKYTRKFEEAKIEQNEKVPPRVE